jgi:hypothetical protein
MFSKQVRKNICLQVKGSGQPAELFIDLGSTQLVAGHSIRFYVVDCTHEYSADWESHPQVLIKLSLNGSRVHAIENVNWKRPKSFLRSSYLAPIRLSPLSDTATMPPFPPVRLGLRNLVSSGGGTEPNHATAKSLVLFPSSLYFGFLMHRLLFALRTGRSAPWLDRVRNFPMRVPFGCA